MLGEGGGCPVYFKIVSSIPEFYSLDASNIPPVLTTNHVSRPCQISFGEQNRQWLKATGLKITLCSFIVLTMCLCAIFTFYIILWNFLNKYLGEPHENAFFSRMEMLVCGAWNHGALPKVFKYFSKAIILIYTSTWHIRRVYWFIFFFYSPCSIRHYLPIPVEWLLKNSLLSSRFSFSWLLLRSNISHGPIIHLCFLLCEMCLYFCPFSLYVGLPFLEYLLGIYPCY